MKRLGNVIVYRKVVDLTHVLEPGSPAWPGDPLVTFETVATIEGNGYYLRRFSMGEHSGTHLNAPKSFHPRGSSVSEYPPGALVTPAVLVDVRERAAAAPDYTLAVEDIRAWERRHGDIPAGSVVLLFTGWQERWSDPRAFLGLDAEGRLHFPGFGVEVARWLLQERRIRGLGTDAPGVEPGWDSSFAVNRLVLEEPSFAPDPAIEPPPRLVLECLAHLDELPPTGATLVIGVLRLRDGSGSPASVLALVP
ncbi:cyclase family protein [Carboxydochorda subterranea]|uniref:Cyclase family protein n=1 Tax=Carboxydichorda subterranea TaxID=3109565 RepID=A0ABZ1BZQ0_9FIRM|nr:cyclase family protein [Limnochorda sp. L945t]WRP17578.1 cyclase family protein [Limnochorda sp. L945t]